jgi:protoporphyrinogen oxidase
MAVDAPGVRQVVIVGGGFTGLAAGYELAKAGVPVTILEAEPEIGGLASAFEVGGERLERFYHHWFTSDLDVMDLVQELGLSSQVEVHPSSTGVYFANSFFRLSTPWDLLNFSPLGLLDRIRLGMLALRARRVTDWLELEDKTAEQWLRELGGANVYRVVWEPLLKGKFGPYADSISAVWFWNKLKLRGGSRGRSGEERLAYFRGGFVRLAEALAERIESLGGRIQTNARVASVVPNEGGDPSASWRVNSSLGAIQATRVIATPALPLIADMVREWAHAEYLAKLEGINYLANICLVLELKRPLSSTYWLNVNDPSFPFVGVVEHTNLEPARFYGGRHVVYLSKYLPHTDPLYSLDADGLLAYALPYLKRMFPELCSEMVLAHHLWRARWSQPVVQRRYGALIPDEDGPRPGFHVCSMAQIYPQDRGTNYAIRNGRSIARRLLGAA